MDLQQKWASAQKLALVLNANLNPTCPSWSSLTHDQFLALFRVESHTSVLCSWSTGVTKRYLPMKY